MRADEATPHSRATSSPDNPTFSQSYGMLYLCCRSASYDMLYLCCRSASYDMLYLSISSDTLDESNATLVACHSVTHTLKIIDAHAVVMWRSSSLHDIRTSRGTPD
jgi:hypothetical protein